MRIVFRGREVYHILYPIGVICAVLYPADKNRCQQGAASANYIATFSHACLVGDYSGFPGRLQAGLTSANYRNSKFSTSAYGKLLGPLCSL